MKMVKVTQKYGETFSGEEIETKLYVNIDHLVTISIDPEDETTCLELDDRDDVITNIIETPEQILDSIKHAEEF